MKKFMVVSIAVIVMATSLLANAAVVALKRDATLTDFSGLDASLTNLTVYSGQGAVADTYINTSNQTLMYANAGGSTQMSQQGLTVLAKFGLNQLPGFAGSTVAKAEVRFVSPPNNGNWGLDQTGYITSSDWSEGNKSGPGLWGYPGDYPGLSLAGQPAMAGASGAHPNGLNTDAYQDANGGTTGPLASWANNQPFAASKDGVASGSQVGTSWVSINGQYYAYTVDDITAMVQAWANGQPNYGMYLLGEGNLTPYMSEETVDANYQPVLVIDYSPVPEPASLVLLALGGLALLRRRSATR